MPENTKPYKDLQEAFAQDVRANFQVLQTEIEQRNEDVVERDDFIYGDRLERSLDIPLGHDQTGVNWLRRTVEIHKNMFMGRGFQVVSTYDTKSLDDAADDQDKKRIQIENAKQKAYAEARQQMIKAIKEDNMGDSLWADLAESASAVGDAAVKLYWDEDEDKIEICPIESIENLYALWESDNFREARAYAYVYQVDKQEAIGEYGASEDVTMSPVGSPMEVLSSVGANGASNQNSGQPMVTVMEVTGKIEGWSSENGRLKKVKVGDEKPMNVMLVGNDVVRLIDDEKKLPKYYIFPNKRQRRRPWGRSDITDAAIYINLTYIETLSDWRTAASRTNFNKYKLFGFGPDVEVPKPQPRKIEMLPLSDGQDIVELNQSQTNGIDWGRQLDELKEQFVRETGISRVLFDDPSVTLNSNQALMTSMKPTSDIAEAKKQLWSPILVELFNDALEMVAANKPELSDIVDQQDTWTLKINWPSVLQKEDPVYQSMLLNRFNAGTMSLQSYLEAQGESHEEVERLKDEMTDPLTAAILGHQVPALAQVLIQAATAEIQSWMASVMPQQQPAQPGQPGQGPPNMPGVNPNGGAAAQVQPDNQATGGVGVQPVSQPGTGATAASPLGALAQANQNQGA